MKSINIEKKYGRIALITTPLFRAKNYKSFEEFVLRYMCTLCCYFKVLITKDTYKSSLKILENSLEKYKTSLYKNIDSKKKLEESIKVIKNNLEVTDNDFIGTTHVAFEIIEQRIDAVIHLMSWEDKFNKPDSAVLSREANVHNVPIAIEIDTAIAFIQEWHSILDKKTTQPNIFLKRAKYINPPLEGLTKNNHTLAIIANDNMKLEVCRFAVENADYIFKNYDYILATGTTGTWVKKFMLAAGRNQEDIKKIRICNSGPLGGDVQIAYAIEKRLCQKVIFLQDPSTSHPHESDIKLFEKAVTSRSVHVKLATNIEAAKILIHK